MRIRLILLLALFGVLVPTQLEAAPAGAPEPSVTVAALNGSVTSYRGCDGNEITQSNDGMLAVIRNGSTAAPLTVNVSYGGTLTPGTDYPALPGSVTIPAGTDRAFLEVESTRPGTVILTVEPNAGYAPGDPATVTTTILDLNFEADCPAAEEQTIKVGETPEDIDVYGRFGGALADTVLQITGDVPPGLTFAGNGRFTGTATEVGSYSFTASYCLNPFCALVLPVTITVVPVDRTLPTTVTAPSGTPATATPAAPVVGQSNFTG